MDKQLKILHIPETVCVDIALTFRRFALTDVNDVNDVSTQSKIDIHNISREMSTTSTTSTQIPKKYSIFLGCLVCESQLRRVGGSGASDMKT